jgi:hypothetical protein
MELERIETMKIEIQRLNDLDEAGEPISVSDDQHTVEVGPREVMLSGVYNGVGVKTKQGLFGIAERDSGIEVMLDGKLVWSSDELNAGDGCSKTREDW